MQRGSAIAPPIGAWPAEMRAVSVAAYLDYPSVGSLYKAVARGEAPRPTAWRGQGRNKERVWARAALDIHLARRHALVDAVDVDDDIEGLI